MIGKYFYMPLAYSCPNIENFTYMYHIYLYSVGTNLSIMTIGTICRLIAVSSHRTYSMCFQPISTSVSHLLSANENRCFKIHPCSILLLANQLYMLHMLSANQQRNISLFRSNNIPVDYRSTELCSIPNPSGHSSVQYNTFLLKYLSP